MPITDYHKNIRDAVVSTLAADANITGISPALLPAAISALVITMMVPVTL